MNRYVAVAMERLVLQAVAFEQWLQQRYKAIPHVLARIAPAEGWSRLPFIIAAFCPPLAVFFLIKR